MSFRREKWLLVFSMIQSTLILCAFCFSNESEFDFETSLRRHLFVSRPHNPSSRPAKVNSSVVVEIGLALRQVVEMNEKHQILLSSLWYRQKWFDKNMIWEPHKFGGIRSFRVEPEVIWVPDITLYNDVREEVREITEYKAIVYNDGNISWNYPVLMKSSCRVDVRYFPFDQQICPLKLGSWAYDGFMIDVVNYTSAGDFSSFVRNGEYKLVDIPVRRHSIQYQCCPEPYPDVTFYIVLRRKPMFILNNLVLPCVVVTLVTMMGFCLPAESGEKISLGITTLLVLFVFLLLVFESMPPNSDSWPLIGQFFVSIIVLLTSSMLSTIFVLNIYFRGQHRNKMPEFTKMVLFDCLGTLLFVMPLVKNMHREQKELAQCHEERKKFSMESVVEMAKKKQTRDKMAEAKPKEGASFVINNEYDLPNSSTNSVVQSTTDSQISDKKLPRVSFRDKLLGSIKSQKLAGIQEDVSASDVKVNVKCSCQLKAVENNVRELRSVKGVVEQVVAKIAVFEKLQLNREETTLIESEWKLAAVIIDRLFLVIFLLANITICVVFFLVKPDYVITEKLLAETK